MYTRDIKQTLEGVNGVSVTGFAVIWKKSCYNEVYSGPRAAVEIGPGGLNNTHVLSDLKRP